MTGKSEILYATIFSTIKSLFHAHKYEIKTKCAMLDFELGSRNAMKFVFPEIEIKDCYFHFCKSLWKKAAKSQLCEETILKDTILLIAFLKISAHIQSEERKEYFAEIKTYFLSKSNLFSKFLKYFEDQWLDNIAIDLGSSTEDLSDRTNNVSESFNSLLNKHIAIYRPSLAVCISKLKELEFHYRQKVLKQINKGINEIQVEEPKVEKLPFSQIFMFIKDRKRY